MADQYKKITKENLLKIYNNLLTGLYDEDIISQDVYNKIKPNLKPEPITILDGYFNSGASFGGTPLTDYPLNFPTLDVTNSQLHKELHEQNVKNNQMALEDFYKSKNTNSKPLIRGRVR